MAKDTVQVDIVTNTQKSQKSLLKYAAIVAGATIAVKKLFDVGQDLVKTYQVQERAEAKLRNAIRATGREGEISADRIGDLASELQAVTTFGDEATISAAALLQQFANLNEEGLAKAIPQVQNMAAALGIDLEQAAQLVGKTIGSSTNALSRYGIEVDSAASQSEKLEQVVAGLESQFGGTAEAIANTSSGAFEQYQNAIGDLKEVAGEGIAQALAPIARNIASFLSENMDTIEAVFQSVPEIIKIAFETGVNAARRLMSFESFRDVLLALAQGTIENLKIAFTTSVGIGAQLIEGLGGVFSALGEYVVGVFNRAWVNVRNRAAEVLDFIGIEIERKTEPSVVSFGEAWDKVLSEVGETAAGVAQEIADGTRQYVGNTGDTFQALGRIIEAEMADGKSAIEALIEAQKALNEEAARGGGESDTSGVTAQTEALQQWNMTAEQAAALSEELAAGAAYYGEQVKFGNEELREQIMTQQELAEAMLGPQVEAFAVLGQAITDASMSWSDYGKAAILAVADTLSAVAKAAFAQAAVLFFTPGSQGQAGGLLAAAIGAQVAAGVVRGLASNVGEGFQFGGDFVVPPGYEGDSFPMRVNSGERVTVTPKSEVQGTTRGGGGMGLEISGTINIYGAGGKEAFLQDLWQSLQRGQKTGALAGNL